MRVRVDDGSAAGRSLAVESVPFVIGREGDCDLVLDDPRVSRHHAQLEVVDDGRVVLRDLESANGTFVGEERIAGGVWFDVPGSFRVGRTALKVEHDDPSDETVTTGADPAATIAVASPVIGSGGTETAHAAPPPAGARTARPQWAPQPAGVGSARSAATRAIASQLALGLSLVAAIVALVLAVRGMGLVDGLDAGTVSDLEILSFEGQSAQAAGLILLSTLLSAIAFLAWLSRSVENAPLLGLGRPPASPRWAIGWWFVPIASFWKPYGVVKDLYERLGGSTAPVAIVTVWWLAWIGGLVLGRVGGVLGDRATTAGDVRWAFMLDVVAEASLAVAAVLAIVLVRRMQAWADAHAALRAAG